MGTRYTRLVEAERGGFKMYHVFNKIIKNIKFIPMKFSIFAFVKIIYILHGQVLVL